MPEKKKAEKKEKNELKELFSWAVYETLDWIKWIIIAYFAAQALNFVFSSALSTSTPVMAVVSTSMLHDSSVQSNYYAWMLDHGFTGEQIENFPVPYGFDKGDALLIKGRDDYDIGDVVVYDHPLYPMPLVHRIVFENETHVRTKGDRNPVIDPWLVEKSAIKGEVVVVVPKIGYVKVLPLDIYKVIVS